MRIIFALLLLAGCGDTFTTPVNREYTRTESHVYWYEMPNEAALYDKCGTPEGSKQTLACAIWTAGTCTIYTHKNPPLETLGHEFLHCFAGRWHG